MKEQGNFTLILTDTIYGEVSSPVIMKPAACPVLPRHSFVFTRIFILLLVDVIRKLSRAVQFG